MSCSQSVNVLSGVALICCTSSGPTFHADHTAIDTAHPQVVDRNDQASVGRMTAICGTPRFCSSDEQLLSAHPSRSRSLRWGSANRTDTGRSVSETDQCATEQGVRRVPAYPALSSGPPVDSNSVTSALAEFDPVLRAPLPQSHLLGLVREIIPPFEGAPSHQQLLISAVSTSSAEDVANFVVV